MHRFIGIMFLFLCLFHLEISAQNDQPILLKIQNASFEGKPQAGTVYGQVVRAWYNCGVKGESVPDIQPSLDSKYLIFDVTKAPYQGDTYTGMVVRDNNTWEALGQELSESLKAKKWHKIEVALARSERYKSPAEDSSQRMDAFDKACVFRLWGGFDYCEKRELLVRSPVIHHSDWKVYEFFFEAQEDYTHLIIEAYFDETTPVYPYNGNLLIDDMGLFLMKGEVDIASKEGRVIEEAAAETVLDKGGRTKSRLRKARGYFKPVSIKSIQEKVMIEKTQHPILNLLELKNYIRDKGKLATFTDQAMLMEFLLRVTDMVQHYQNKKLLIEVTDYELEKKTKFLKAFFKQIEFDGYEIRPLPIWYSDEQMEAGLSYNDDFCWKIEEK